MKILKFSHEGKSHFGILENKSVFIAEGDNIFSLTKTEKQIPLDEVKILPPLIPNKFIAIGLNYKKHAEEVNKPLPEEPMMFLISPSAVIGTDEVIKIKNKENRTEHEGELAIVIGKTCKNVEKHEADEYIFGYTISNDISDRVVQKKDTQFTRAKSYDTYKPLGPYVVTDIDPNNLKIEVTVNDEIRQSSSTSDMIFSPQELVSFLSKAITLEQGDVIITGTPEGVSPLKGGDIVKVCIEKIGCLTNKVEA